ncbi:MAG TPA: hypothetical protein VHU23_02885 [Rhizomicrobium sp.]|jgi:hypothetical protein|nr:hypothetical protein [Rhizomicrobium sp.]
MAHQIVIPAKAGTQLTGLSGQITLPGSRFRAGLSGESAEVIPAALASSPHTVMARDGGPPR